MNKTSIAQWRLKNGGTNRASDVQLRTTIIATATGWQTVTVAVPVGRSVFHQSGAES